MPTLRWFGRSRVTSWPLIRIAPELGASKPATMRRVVVLPQPLGPRNEMNSPRSIARAEFWTTVGARKALRIFSISRKAMPIPLPRRYSTRVRRRPAGAAADELHQPHARPGDDEGDDGERRRLVGAVGADQLQVGAEGRTVEQTRHRELADDDREGEKGAAEHARAHIGEDTVE